MSSLASTLSFGVFFVTGHDKIKRDGCMTKLTWVQHHSVHIRWYGPDACLELYHIPFDRQPLSSIWKAYLQKTWSHNIYEILCSLYSFLTYTTGLRIAVCIKIAAQNVLVLVDIFAEYLKFAVGIFSCDQDCSNDIFFKHPHLPQILQILLTVISHL